MKLIDIYSRKKKDMTSIEKVLFDSVLSENEFLRDASTHLIKAGGKRIRPVFVLLSGEFGTYHLDEMKLIAVPLELIHMATLVHDDVIDDADLRRGRLTVRSKWDNRVAMYTGDYIFAKALHIITQIQQTKVHQIMSNAIVEMCIGEMEQIRYFFNVEQSIRDYLLRIKRKTALLIAISCQLGAMVSNTPTAVSNKLYSFGYNVGMAFQIRDDILDLTGSEKQTGKPPGSDIRQGNITIPIIFALQNPVLKPRIIEELVKVKSLDGQTDVTNLIRLIIDSGGIEQADALSQKYIQKATAALENLPELQAKKDLMNIAHFIGNRNY
jgi:heptaprenyl diphosphate synthase